MFLKKYSNLILIIFFVFLINMATLVHIKNTEFPFISFFHKETVNDFNFNELNFKVSLSQEFKERVSNDLGPVLQDKKDVFFISSVLAKYVRSHLFHKSNTIHNVDEILESPDEHPAICSGYSKFLVSLAQAMGYEARVIWLNGHTVSEIYFPEYGWVLVDTSGNLIFQDKDGKYVSLLYVVEHFEDVIPKRLVVESQQSNISSNGYIVFDDNDVIVVIEGPRLFDFDIRTKSPKVLINYILGKEDVAQGIQYTAGGRERLGNYRISVIALIIFDFFAFIFFICYLFLRREYPAACGGDESR